MSNVKENLSDISEILQQYTDDVVEIVDRDAQKISRAATSELRSTSPRSNSGSTRHYAEGWKVQTEHGRYSTSSTIYNATKPGLTHLLEYGHAQRNGGRTRAIVHIRPVEEKAVEEFEEAVRKDVRRG